MILSNHRRRLLGASKIRLPKEYTEVEYLQLTGYQYINTGFIPTSKTSASYKYSMSELKNWGPHILNADNLVFPFLRRYNTSADINQENIMYRRYTEGASKYVFFVSQANTIYEFEAWRTNDKILINGVEIGTAEAGEGQESSSPLYLACYYGEPDSLSYTLVGNLYYCKIWEDNEPVRNFVPCYRNSDGLAGMYDTVFDMFYPSNGTEDFIAGGEV